MINIRQELPKDYTAVEAMIRQTYKKSELGYRGESLLVANLRTSDAFIPELSLVAELYGQIVGHILLVKIKISNANKSIDSLAFGPMSVDPSVQRSGIGSMLIQEAHQIAKTLGYDSIVLVGHEDYYPKFGYVPASQFGIKFPFEAPDAACMAIELVQGALAEADGVVVYPEPFLAII
ncbi:MAG: N-acetyltransferase [Bacteroidia bacterium]|nr:N-acetyltransferase [Bacteroidia bacterium]